MKDTWFTQKIGSGYDFKYNFITYTLPIIMYKYLLFKIVFVG